MDGHEAASYFAGRSVCRIRVGAAILNRRGRLVSGGWNHAGSDGLGEHAEVHAIKRAIKKRKSLKGCAIYVVAWRGPRTITSKPCDDCWKWLERAKLSDVHFQFLKTQYHSHTYKERD